MDRREGAAPAIGLREACREQPWRSLLAEGQLNKEGSPRAFLT